MCPALHTSVEQCARWYALLRLPRAVDNRQQKGRGSNRNPRWASEEQHCETSQNAIISHFRQHYSCSVVCSVLSWACDEIELFSIGIMATNVPSFPSPAECKNNPPPISHLSGSSSNPQIVHWLLVASNAHKHQWALSAVSCFIRLQLLAFMDKKNYRHLWADCLDNVGSLTSYNPISIHGLLRG
jgi:hypothetical protein